MTNAEKFIEVFGTDLKRQHITRTWWEQEFIPYKACDDCKSPCVMYEKGMKCAQEGDNEKG